MVMNVKPLTHHLLESSAKRLAAVALLVAASATSAAIDSPIVFSQTGQVMLTVTGNQGGFDHLLQGFLVSGNGVLGATVPTSNFVALSDGGSTVAFVGDLASPIPTFPLNVPTFDFGTVSAGQEITLRLTNLQTDRIGGTPSDILGTIYSQLNTGSSVVNNTTFVGGSVLGNTPGSPIGGSLLGGGYSFVNFVSPTRIDVGFTDLFVGANTPFDNVTMTLTLTPVPEPASALMLLLGLGVLGVHARRRATLGDSVPTPDPGGAAA